ncbi:MAG: TIGR02680 family protein [Lachnospiraceae bacterium]|nr:TIGR02680 family protein [Lachnospiraceae bacterium]
MNSEWQLNRIGLLDFWYYDEQEFDFLDGRMLLRGANGSGKSVTMQSFIPLLLDGNMRPERLDPFGSRARKMENYLLEEGDGREERTGYLYMELKRLDSDVYTTIGIGIRARKNKKLDTWYFCVTDGRRIGKELFLYKDVQSRLTYTKQELKNRIGEGGRVMETQGEYAQCVNRLLFGFETMEEYEELIELLIQLRTPKLSKDFKPSIINEILSRSLQTLSEDDLRPMSEAIENMDNLKTNLDALNDSVRAAEQIERAFGQYNEIVLYDKAMLFSNASKECRNLERKARDLMTQKEESIRQLTEETERYENLRQEEEVLKQEEGSLRDSDAARLKQQELTLEEQCREAGEEAAGKAKQEQEKKEKYLETEQKRREQQERNELIWSEIKGCLEEMEEYIEDVPFEEFAFMEKELTAEPEKEYDFASHGKLLSEYMKRVETGRDALLEEQGCRERYDRKQQELDEYHREQEQKEREWRQCENLLCEIRDEVIEKFYQWEKRNKLLHLPDEIKQKIAQSIEQYGFGMDYSEIRNLGKDIFFNKDREIDRSLREKEQKKQELTEEYNNVLAELEDWRGQKDPEPECSEAVRKNRHLLQEKGIPFLQFYKTIDFGAQMSGEQAARVEEALLSMGILDALIVPAEYREQIKALDPGVCDRYIFSDVAHVKQNLLELLDVDNGENDILKYQSVANILSSIGMQAVGECGSNTGTWVDTEGNYRIGVLEGTITRDYTARYIGVRARENFRMEKIAGLEQQTVLLEGKLAEYEMEIGKLERDRERLQAEWEAFPSDEDLKTAAKEYADKSYELGRLNHHIVGLRDQLQQVKAELDEIQLRVREACGKCYLTARLDIFVQALENIGAYRELLTQVQIRHEKYLGGIQYMYTLEENLETIDGDLDAIRYELGRLNRRVSELKASLQSVREQLTLTDYEAIRERLDYCLNRLNRLPAEREEAARRQTHWKDEWDNLEKELQKQEMDYQNARKKASCLEKAFAAEYELGYVERCFVVNEDMEDQAGKVCTMLSGKFGSRKQADLQSSLQEAYHQNRGYLLDYHLTMQSLFEEENPDEADHAGPAISMRRIDIVAKYRGVNVHFRELLEKLRVDAEDQRRLLSDKDRELFEDILANTVSKKIRVKIQASNRWVEKMNQLMDSMKTSSGLKLSLNWKKKRAEKEEQLDTRELVELLAKDVEIMREEEAEKLSLHFRSKIAEARKISEDGNSVQSFHAIIREVLDYRKWFEFTLECQKIGEKKKELTDRVFFTFSGGEKAMAMYVPLFSAVVAKYAGARENAPHLISLDEAFAGVDETNIRDMFRLMVECKFNFMINSQVLWGDYDTIPGLAIYQLLRPENVKFVTVIAYIWNGKERILTDTLEKSAEYGTN